MERQQTKAGGNMDQSADAVHKAAVGHIPVFITSPGQTDVLLNIVIIFLICVVFLTGVLYLRLHALPEHIAHQTNKIQLQLVAVLGLIALFTHNQLFWIAALLLAMTDLPDFLSPVTSMARSLRTIARRGLHLTIPPSDPAPTVGGSDNVAPQTISPSSQSVTPSTVVPDTELPLDQNKQEQK
ncbi:hypothetical protein CQ052_16225 [Ochrobactrum sp. MYb15]|uniref:hypothetical protein n=1 Tax=Brucella TaxID=234 RepID=UPI000467A817|nr:hypothetical protein [Brucella rhizosphaerae]PQZ50769.1 hypothetical protein CQZ90_09350 [Ochrobactrum sp. MYb19]PRA52083.1 hypothetical protein CQ062_18770 [Ochrobactrum sp. MYb68]PRA68809.1 hypothetical protein CQ053_04345 [Ochrobactrum sp. MYb18]PRA73963.1 hypothetical protein CQ049_11740 [Brucella thiophenivorans]PRA91061.1 hypothetical protein CQ051_14250 [Ochrobactrum sp. MYb14]PRA96512.1 hypothetical protein CQ052_16225 [Ochrobactrum sp. MYb15]